MMAHSVSTASTPIQHVASTRHAEERTCHTSPYCLARHPSYLTRQIDLHTLHVVILWREVVGVAWSPVTHLSRTPPARS